MAPENDAPDNVGQGEVGGGAPADSGQGFDYERGYAELRPEYTRATQRLSEYEQLFAALQDPETQAEALDALGFEMDTGSPASTQQQVDDFVDPLEEELKALREEVTDLRSARELEADAQQQEEILALRDDFIGDAISFIEESTNVKFTPAEEEVLGNLAIAMEGEDGVPDVQAAYNRLYGTGGVIPTVQERYITHKQTAAMPPLGTTIPSDRRPQTRKDRIQYIDERVRAAESQQ